MTSSLATDVGAIVSDRLGPIEVDATPVDHHERLVWLAAGASGPLVIKADVDAERHRRELLGLRAAQQTGCPVPEVIDRVGGPVNVLVITHLHGSPLQGDDPSQTWAAVGAAVRDLHRSEPTGERGIGSGDGAAERIAPSIDYVTGGDPGTARPLIDAGLDFVRRRLVAAVEGVQVHGDCQPDHFLLDETRTTVTGILDFGDAGLGDPLWDLAVLTLEHPEHIDDVLVGYQPDPSMAERARYELPAYHALRCLTDIRWLREHDFDPTPYQRILEEIVDQP